MKPSLVLYFIISAFLMSTIKCLQNDQDIIEDKEKLFEDPDFVENIDEIAAEVEQSPLQDESNEAGYDEEDNNALITEVTEFDKNSTCLNQDNCRRLTTTERVCGKFTIPRRCNKRIAYRVQSPRFIKVSKRVCSYNTFFYKGRKCRSSKYYTITKFKVAYRSVMKHKVYSSTCFSTKQKCKTITFTASPNWRSQLVKNTPQ
ncbi:PREDICTED: uncharacterized protein LOC109582925 isoform X2 [Amphimedon queenslandica]|uniref:Uncharacterized protein n=1 Tax=Amphimedon queenslandica TaxID=400682 RepID=A0AAN0J944_AMPQE|nr:PREDICTED: uncharacterized protein LOC109582925 isoform X2 [Amphimedon queenslandica]|eukprot:XP_019853555.1 PREDICTED: uncharacterized protein LOC109582925 isoform X2 [Amphimedon queenslandica]